jgi:V/A-type H+-transporting ATPase subunit K
MDKTKSGKKAFGRQLLVLGVALTVAFSCMGVAYAAEDGEPVPETAVTEVAEETQSDGGIAQGLSFIGAALAIGLAAIGAGIALASGAPAAIGAVAEDPKSFGKAMIFVALGEAVAIYGFIIAFLMILPTLQ